jgi:hypothetical protein
MNFDLNLIINTFLNVGMKKVKVKVTPEQTTKAQRERYSSTLSLTSALDGGGWSTPRPGRLTPEKSPVAFV